MGKMNCYKEHKKYFTYKKRTDIMGEVLQKSWSENGNGVLIEKGIGHEVDEADN